MSFLKPKPATSTSNNQAYGLIKSTYSPQMNAGVGATNILQQLLLGGGGGGGATSSGPSADDRINRLLGFGADNSGRRMREFAAANPNMGADERFQGIYNLADDSEKQNFDKWAADNPTVSTPGGSGVDAFAAYKDQAGYAPALRDLSRGVVGGAAAKGLLNSGASRTALLKKGAELDQSMFNNFLQQLSGLSGLGLQAGSLVSGAGQQSTSNSGGPSTAGTIAKGIGTIASIFSDRRLKRNITLLSVLPDGLGVYAFRMIDDPEMRLGVMADEVAELRPHALGPVVGGFRTVNYGAL
jgi:hypothetical protein